MTLGTNSPIVRLMCRVVARVIQVYAVYVVFHGHYSPGGGFQGGGLLAAAVFLLRIGEGNLASQSDLSSRLALVLGSVGALIFLIAGFVVIPFGGLYLEYGRLPFPTVDPASLHYWMILIVEFGVALAVMAILVAIFDQLMERTGND